MEHHIILSNDGSHTLKLEGVDECYHSSNGAYSESEYIYIRNGVDYLYHNLPDFPSLIDIYDIGLGSGLNCMTSLIWHYHLGQNNGGNIPPVKIHFHGIEKYPISIQEAEQINFPQYIAAKSDIPLELLDQWFHAIHSCEWEKDVEISPNFVLNKHLGDISTAPSDYFSSESPSVVMYDTFSPSTQPELWAEPIFKAIYEGIQPQSLILTYCSKGVVKQRLRGVGFTLERLPGPPGKRHILRGTK